MKVDGVILAGGLSSRMNNRMKQDKALLQVHGKSLLTHHIELMQPEVGQLFIASRNVMLPKIDSQLKVVKDFLEGSEGPLSGILPSLQASSADFMWLMSCDNFGFSVRLKDQLLAILLKTGADVAYITHEGNLHPLMAMLRTSLHASLLAFLQEGGRSVLKWYATLNTVTVESEESAVHYNINTWADYEALISSKNSP